MNSNQKNINLNTLLDNFKEQAMLQESRLNLYEDIKLQYEEYNSFEKMEELLFIKLLDFDI